MHNRSAAGRRGTRSDILGTLAESDQTLEALAAALFPHYRRLRKWRGARDLAQRKVDQFSALPPGTVVGLRRLGLRAGADRPRSWPRSGWTTRGCAPSPPPWGTPTLDPDGVRPALRPRTAAHRRGPGHRARAGAWGVTGASRVAEAGSRPAASAGLGAPPGCRLRPGVRSRGSRCPTWRRRIEAARERTDRVWDTEETLVGLEPNQSYWAFRLGCYRSMMRGVDTAALADLRGQIAANESAAVLPGHPGHASPADRARSGCSARWPTSWSWCTRNRGKAGSEVRALVEQVVEALLPALEVLRATDMSHGPHHRRQAVWRPGERCSPPPRSR